MKFQKIFAIKVALLTCTSLVVGAASCLASLWVDPRGESAAIEELSPWLKEVETRVTAVSSYDTTKRSLLRTLDDNEKIVCSFSVKESGEIENLKVDGFPKSVEIKERFSNASRRILKLIHSSNPLPVPANSITSADERGVQIEFDKAGKALIIRANIPRHARGRLVNGRIGEFGSDYQDPHPIVRYRKYPWPQIQTIVDPTADVFSILPCRNTAASCVPPFPALIPQKQQDYEQTLNLSDQAWIAKSSANSSRYVFIGFDGDGYISSFRFRK
ncbi:MAG: hypothetical protein JST89_18000 [Cyanobacteria bacterium SZAS-4]|nr:hypothetical protein [Cyanobacteria bacterium SZAS-4]